MNVLLWFIVLIINSASSNTLNQEKNTYAASIQNLRETNSNITRKNDNDKNTENPVSLSDKRTILETTTQIQNIINTLLHKENLTVNPIDEEKFDKVSVFIESTNRNSYQNSEKKDDFLVTSEPKKLIQTNQKQLLVEEDREVTDLITKNHEAIQVINAEDALPITNSEIFLTDYQSSTKTNEFSVFTELQNNEVSEIQNETETNEFLSTETTIDSSSTTETTVDPSSTTESSSEPSSTPETCPEVPTIESLDIESSSFNVTISWIPFDDCVDVYVIYFEQETYNTTEPTFTIENLNACHEYNVAVTVSYRSSTGQNTTDNFKTKSPEDFSEYTVGDLQAEKSGNEVLVTWKAPPMEVFNCIENYHLQWSDADEQEPIGGINLNSSETSFSFPIIPCMNTTIRIYPESINGAKAEAVSSSYYAEPQPFSKPTVINEPQTSKTEVFVILQSDDISINKCEIEKISYSCEAPQDANSDHPWIIREVKNETVEETSANFTYQFVISGLSPFTNYTCDVSIFNTGGESESAIFDFQTNEDVPSKPQQLQVTEIQSSYFRLSWLEPEKVPGIMTHYVLLIENLGPQFVVPPNCDYNNSGYSVNLSSESNSYNFLSATPFSKYSVTLYGVDGAGEGENTTTEIITAASKPESVKKAKMSQPSYSETETYEASVEVTFEPPCFTNGLFKNYKINVKGIRSGFEDIEFNLPTIEARGTVNLSPERNYSISIEVLNENFTSDAVDLKIESQSGVPILGKSISAPISNDTYLAYFNLKKDSFSNENGDIIAYCLILLTAEAVPSYGFWNQTNSTWPPVQKEARQLTPNFWNPFEEDTDSITFVIGNNDDCSQNHCNKALNEDTKYWLLVRALTRAAYKDSMLLHFKTEMLDELNLGLILGLTFGLLTLLALVIFGVILWRQKRLQIPKVEQEKRTSTSPEPVPIQKFANYYVTIKENYDLIKWQFTELGNKAKEAAGEITFAVLPENKRKNRYTNILPYDATRVSLKIDEDDEISSDYINASYITGYTGKIEYIATQGPLASTARDFWKMVLQENVTIIAMVSQFVEQNKEKCYQYFPSNHEQAYFGEDLEVKCSTELHFGTYCVRTLQIRKNTLQRDVYHMQFLEWPDFGVPQGTDNMLQFCNQMREKLNKEGGLIAVHCSAGVGRTGTLIALDILLQTIDDHRDINIYKTVLDLRKQRTNMVQTEKQYMFIHTCVKDYIEAPPIQTTVDDSERIYENVDVIRSSMEKNLIASEIESAL